MRSSVARGQARYWGFPRTQTTGLFALSSKITGRLIWRYRSEDVNPNLTRTILERCKQLAPELLVDGEFEVMQVQIGRRPARRGGVRIEVESLETTGGKRLVCHHYGHGGMGSDSPWPPLADAPFRRLTLKGSFQTAVGSANEAVRLLLKAMSNDRTSKL